MTSAYAGKSHVRRVEHLKVGGPSPGELVNRGASGVAVDWWVLPVPREGFLLRGCLWMLSVGGEEWGEGWGRVIFSNLTLSPHQRKTGFVIPGTSPPSPPKKTSTGLKTKKNKNKI